MAQYTSFEALLNDLQKQVNETLVDDVAPVVKEVESDTVNEVLSEYTPSGYNHYERRETDGLDDVTNMTEKLEGNTLIIENNTEFNQSQDNNPNYHTSSQGIGLAGLVEYGDGWNGFQYDYKRGSHIGEFTKPRGFTERTKEKIIETNAHVEALKDGLRKKGFNVK